MENINLKDNSKAIARKKRGKIAANDLEPFINYNYKELVAMLSDENSQKRTIAATLLNNDNIGDEIDDIAKDLVISELSKFFKVEKALYSKLAMSNTLASYNILAIPYLINLLGKIGDNQEKELPKKYFNKKSFPLPRDLAGRTLVKIGSVATPFLMDVLSDEYSSIVKEQAIDAIGAIAYKYGDHRAINQLKTLYKSENDTSLIIVWKIARSLSGFKNNIDALNLLMDIFKSYIDYVEIQWECIRSIGQIGIVNSDVRDIFTSLKVNNIHLELALKVSRDSLGL